LPVVRPEFKRLLPVKDKAQNVEIEQSMKVLLGDMAEGLLA
jgi:hypothetical protein